MKTCHGDVIHKARRGVFASSCTVTVKRETMNGCQDEHVLVPPRNLEELVKELHKVFSFDRVNVDYVKALLSSYKSNPKEWKKYAKFDQHR